LAEKARPHENGSVASWRATRAKTLAFAAEAHRNHHRKGASQEPCINHLIWVVVTSDHSGYALLMATTRAANNRKPIFLATDILLRR